MIFVAYRIYESQMHNIAYCDHKGLISKSDHLVVIYEPSGTQKVKTIKKKITIRQFKKSAIIQFGGSKSSKFLYNHVGNDW